MKTLPIALLIILGAITACSSNKDKGFEFAVIGDTPYNDTRKAELDELLDEVGDNKNVEFVVHAGDFKSGSTECTDALFEDRLALFNTSKKPFIYVTGDNEWTDCHRANNGSFNPIERLDKLRELFFATPESLGVKTITLTRQSDVTTNPAFAPYRENVRWTRQGVVFIGLNVQGSNNGQNQSCSTLFPTGCPPLDNEFPTRNAANLDWLNQAFDMAESTNAPGMVVMIQGNPLKYYLPTPGQIPRKSSTFPIEVPLEGFSTGYLPFLLTLRVRSAQYGKPVLFIHGDTHTHRIDRPYTGQVGELFGETIADGGLGDGIHPIPNVTRMETYGNPVTQWTRVTVDPKSSVVFSFEDGGPGR